MLKSIVNGAEHDIISIPMKGKNLLNENASSDADATHINYNKVTPVVLIAGQSYTFSCNMACNGLYIRSVSDDSNIASANNSRTLTYTPQVNVSVYFRIWNNSGITNLNPMFNSGSTALPYEPYGYQNGWEVRDNQNRLIWGREDELQTTTGTLPFKGYDLPVKVKSLLGNSVQNGTPSPDNVVIPEFCGVRTENLSPPLTEWVDGYVTINGDIASPGDVYKEKSSDYIPIKAGASYTFSRENGFPGGTQPWRAIGWYTQNKTIISRASGNSSDALSTNAPSNAVYCRLSYRTHGETTNTMFNAGSTALPYEPYGYKIPFNNNGENLISLPNATITVDTLTVVSDVESITLSGSATTVWGSNPAWKQFDFTLEAGEYTFSLGEPRATQSAYAPRLYKYDDNSAVCDFLSGGSTTSRTFTLSERTHVYIGFYIYDKQLSNDKWVFTLNPSSTNTIYLGETPTIRRIKKLVLTGDENYTYQPDYSRYVFTVVDAFSEGTRTTQCFCTHFQSVHNGELIVDVPDKSIYINYQSSGTQFCIKDETITSASDFKAYLTDQYSSGKPVTIWYILAEPETGIVNEPICKISTYADEITTIKVNGLSAPLYGIGDYKDILNLSTGVVTRKIKKIVLTGNENIGAYDSTYSRFSIILSDSLVIGVRLSPIVCSHYQGIWDGRGLNDTPNNSIYSDSDNGSGRWFIKTTDYTESTSYKQYLTDQYTNGTPVTIWYILETPETETVTVPTGMTGEIEGYLTQISTPTPTNRSVPKWNGKEETGGTYAVTVYTPPEIPTTTGKNTLTVDTTLAPYNVTIDGHIKYTYWGKIREDVRSGLAQTKFPVGTILYDNEDETTGRAFQVVGYDKHFDPSLTARGYTHSMTLCQLKLSGPWQYDAIEAFLYTTVEMQPGTYKFKIPNYDTAYGGNKTYYFTSTASVPVDSQITLSWAYQHLPSTVTAYAGPNPQTNTTAITGFNALQLSEWVEGESPEAIDLGTIKLANNDPDSAYGKLNHIHRARYGSNNYYQSGLRQLLNTDLASNNWWHPTTIFDRPYANRTTNGYLRSLNEDFINVLATPEITHIANNIFEYPSLDGRTFALNTEYKINTDKVFLLSHTEVDLSASPNIGTVLDYYSTHNTNADRIKYRLDNGNAYYWWFRTPYPTYASHFRFCITSGALDNLNANSSRGVAPACIIQ